MQTLLADLGFAVRTLAKSYGFTAVAVLTLAFGIGANTAMFSTLDAAFFRTLPFDEPDRLVMGRATFDGDVNPMMSSQDFYDYREQAASLRSFSAFNPWPLNVTVIGGDEPEQLSAIWASWDLFRTVGIDPVEGRHFSEEEGEDGAPPVAVISDRYAQRRFGDSRAAPGEALVIDGLPHTIVGVMPADFHLFVNVDLWRPLQPNGPFAGARRFHNWIAVGRLADDVSLRQAQAEVDLISGQLAAEYPDTNEGKALLLTDLHEVLVEGQRTSLMLLMCAVGLVLLIACGNVANLLLVRGSARRGELAVRSALGASRGRIVRQLLTESVVIAFLSGIVGVVLAVWLQNLILRLMPLNTVGITELGFSMPMLAFALLAALATSLLFGTIPALHGAPTDVAQQLKAAGRTGTARRGARMRSGLVVGQVALSVVLLIGSGLMLRSLSSLMSEPLGFETGNLITAEFRMPGSEYEGTEQLGLFFTELLEEVRAIPGVREAGLISQLPIRDPGNNIYVYDARKPPVATRDADLAYTRNVIPGYFRTMEIPLLAGRLFDATDAASGPPVMVIDETFAETVFPDESPLGKQVVIDFGQPVTAEVVGVVGGVKVSNLRYDNQPTMYFPFTQMASRTMRIAIRTGADTAGVVSGFRGVVRRLDPNLPIVDLDTMDALIAASFADDRVVAGSLTLFAAVALVLAIVGLYGVLAYYVVQRRREIGVRLAIGAQQGRILRWILVRGMTLVVIGVLLGVAGAFAATRLIESLLFGVESVDLVTFVGVSVLFAVVAMAACLIPSWRATRVDPVIALSAE